MISKCTDAIETRVTYVVNIRNLDLDTFAFPHLGDDLSGQRGGVKWRSTLENLPMVEDQLWEGLSGSVSLDVEQRSTNTLVLLEDVTTSAGEHTVDTTHSLLGNLDLDQVNGLLQSRVGEEGSGVQDTTRSRDDLATATMDSIGVEGDIHDVEADRTHGLLGNGTFLGGPLETRDDGILDFVQVLNGLGLVDEQVGTSGLRTEAPNLTGVGDIPAVLISQDTGTSLEIVTGTNLALLDGGGDLLVQRLSNNVETVVLVGRLGQSSHAGGTTDGLTWSSPAPATTCSPESEM
ncbi:hypothetical protein HBH70_139460 [Parastagonospora nodorum]|nr:hypothetical protein HBH48_076270 [Parastagonospora nodorum]KAH5134256.1 hypothetical protein HBH70_139460 [Parastagonospora nodorum]